MKNKLLPMPLTVEAFAPFGEVLEDKTAKIVKDINENTTKRFHDLANIALGVNDIKDINDISNINNVTDASDKAERIGISLFRGSPRPRPIRIAMLEYHPLASQAFLPAAEKEWLVVVAPGSKTAPDMSQAKCFIASGKQGVNYHPSTWHHPLLTHSEQDFWVIDRIAPEGESSNANLCEYWCKEEEVLWIDL